MSSGLMHCESCQSEMKPRHNQSHYWCAACGKFHFPNSLETSFDPINPLGKKVEFNCPKCSVDLEVGILHNRLDVCFCNECRGFVIDSESLRVLIHELRGTYNGPIDQPVPIDPTELQESTLCPCCLTRMESHPYYGPGNVVVNSCRECQINWMDHGELGVIVRAPGVRPEIDSCAFASKAIFVPEDPLKGIGQIMSKNALRFLVGLDL